MAGGRVAGLADARVEAEVADQLARRGEAADVTDAAMKVAAVCTLTPGTLISRSTSGQASACLAISRVERRDLAVEEVDLAQAAVEGQPLVDGQLERRRASAGRPCRRRR